MWAEYRSCEYQSWWYILESLGFKRLKSGAGFLRDVTQSARLKNVSLAGGVVHSLVATSLCCSNLNPRHSFHESCVNDISQNLSTSRTSYQVLTS